MVLSVVPTSIDARPDLYPQTGQMCLSPETAIALYIGFRLFERGGQSLIRPCFPCFAINIIGNLLSLKDKRGEETNLELGPEAEEEEIDVIWDENGTARYRLLKDRRLVDFDGHTIAWVDEDGFVYDYKGHYKAFYENGILRDQEGAVIGQGQDPVGPKPILPNKGLIPEATRPEKPPTKPKLTKDKDSPKKPVASLLWSRKMLEEL